MRGRSCDSGLFFVCQLCLQTLWAVCPASIPHGGFRSSHLRLRPSHPVPMLSLSRVASVARQAAPSRRLAGNPQSRPHRLLHRPTQPRIWSESHRNSISQHSVGSSLNDPSSSVSFRLAVSASPATMAAAPAPAPVQTDAHSQASIDERLDALAAGMKRVRN